MTNEKTQPFNVEEWLTTKKKGFGGKVPRADFIEKIKELNELAEKFKKETAELSEKNQKLTTNLQEKDKIIAENKTDLTNLQEKISEQSKTLENQAQELEKLQQRPDISPEKYRELLNNQEKHSENDLKPTNLPSNWEQQLADKKVLVEDFQKLTTKVTELEKSLSELRKRPTAEDLSQAVQKVEQKYKDFVKLEPKEQAAINNYAIIQKELEQKITAYESLKVELEQLKLVQPAKEPQKEIVKDNSELITEIKKLFAEDLFAILKEISTNLFSLQSEIAQLKKDQQNSTELPADYENVKKLNGELYEILLGVKNNLVKDK